MKKLNQILFFAAFITIIVSGCNTNKPSYTINGTIDLESGTIYLQSFRNKMFFVIDSARIENGTFQFAGSVEHTDLFGLTINRDEAFSPWFIFIENTEIRVDIEIADLRRAKITGSESQKLFERYLDYRQNFNIDSLISEHPTSVVPAYILYRDYITRYSAEQLQENVAKLDPSLHQVEYVQEIKNVISKRQQVKVGNKAIDFTSTSPEGAQVSLSEFEDNYVLLQFWASWCGPCRRSNPGYVRLYNTYNDRGFDILSVSLDNNRQSWINAIEADQLVWTHVSDLQFWDSEPASLYGVRNIPSNLLIDPQGTILGINLNETEIDAILRLNR